MANETKKTLKIGQPGAPIEAKAYLNRTDIECVEI